MRPSSFAALVLLAGASATLAAEAPRDLAGDLDGRLVRLEAGRLVPAELPGDARLVAFYFGAGWCGPCRTFMPELKRGHARLAAAGAPVAMIFVSDDAGCRAMADYVATARMPWPVVACRERARLPWLARTRGRTLPGLLVYDVRGRMLITSWSRGGASRPRDALARLERLAAREYPGVNAR